MEKLQRCRNASQSMCFKITERYRENPTEIDMLQLMATLAQTIVSCYSRTNASDEMNITTFYNELYSLVSYIPQH